METYLKQSVSKPCDTASQGFSVLHYTRVVKPVQNGIGG